MLRLQSTCSAMNLTHPIEHARRCQNKPPQDFRLGDPFQIPHESRSPRVHTHVGGSKPHCHSPYSSIELLLPSRSNYEVGWCQLRMEILVGFYMRPRGSPCQRSNGQMGKAKMWLFHEFKPKLSSSDFSSHSWGCSHFSLMAFETLQAKREASIIKGTSGQVKTLNKAVRSVASFAS